MNFGTSNLYCWDDNGQVYRIPPAIKINNGPALVAQIAAQEPRRIDSAFVAGSITWNLSSAPARTIIAAQLSALKIRTHYRLDGVTLAPCWTPDNNHDAIDTTCTWIPPADGKLWLAIVATRTGRIWATDKVFLFFTSPRRPGNLLPPTPNIYQEGKLCFGNQAPTESKQAPSLSKLAENIIGYLESSRWNRDLIENIAQAPGTFFRFDPATMTSLPSPNDWPDQCRLFSNANLEGAPIS